jgi:serine/threonine protein kinase
MIIDFVQGGDFFTLMRKFRRMKEEWVQVYIAEIALALQHLHDMDIVYRDLKVNMCLPHFTCRVSCVSQWPYPPPHAHTPCPKSYYNYLNTP